MSVEDSIVDDRLLISLYHEHYVSIVKLTYLLIGNREIAEEIAQDSFVKLHTAKSKPFPGKEAAWLRSVALNAARNKLRRKKLGLRLERSVEQKSVSFPEDSLVEKSIAIEKLRSLPRRQREVLVLRYFLDLTETETAETLEVSAGSVKTHARRGLGSLRSTLEESNEL